MAAASFRFLHASDLHLEQPFYGVAELPDALRELIIDAPIAAAERVFDAAIQNKVDFVVLSGDVLNLPVAGPRAISFLLKQLEQLSEQGIAVYWANGEIDALDRWPTSLTLPDQVFLFGHETAQSTTHYRENVPLATLVGIGGTDPHQIGPSDLRSAGEEEFLIAVAHGQANADRILRTNVSYWALGGIHQRQLTTKSQNTLHYPGTSQGRCPQEAGVHGCSLVTVDQNFRADVQLVETDLVRWQTEHLRVDGGATGDQVRQQLGQRMLELVDESLDRARLISWIVDGPQQLGWLQGEQGLAAELTKWLRQEFADPSSNVWTVSLEIKPVEDLLTWSHDEESILGQFLGHTQHFRTTDGEPIGLDKYLSKELADTLAAAVRLTDPVKRDQVLRDASMLGMEILRAG